MMRAMCFHAGEWPEVDVDTLCLSLVKLKNGRVLATVLDICTSWDGRLWVFVSKSGRLS